MVNGSVGCSQGQALELRKLDGKVAADLLDEAAASSIRENVGSLPPHHGPLTNSSLFLFPEAEMRVCCLRESLKATPLSLGSYDEDLTKVIEYGRGIGGPPGREPVTAPK